MSPFRSVAPLLLTAFAVVAGCAAESAEEIDSEQSALRLTAENLGEIMNGQTRVAHYTTSPAHRSFDFQAKGGDLITVEVKSANGDAKAYITDADLEVLAENDNAVAGTRDAKVTYVVPDGTPARQYRAAFRDLQLTSTTLQVRLHVRGPGPAVCNYNGLSYAVGDAFAATTSCNTCECRTGGQVSCTQEACACNPAQEPYRTYLGTPEQCVTLSYDCPAGQTPFSNACGCGCERPH